jgi:hypothetical protein
MKKEETLAPARPRMPRKLVLNKETIRVLTDGEMMEVQGASCPVQHPVSTCVSGPPTTPGSGC